MTGADAVAPTLPGVVRAPGVLSGPAEDKRVVEDCVPVSYAKGGDYLLFLKHTGGGLSLYWLPGAPVNQRVTGADDVWVKQVESELTAAKLK